MHVRVLPPVFPHFFEAKVDAGQLGIDVNRARELLAPELVSTDQHLVHGPWNYDDSHIMTHLKATLRECDRRDLVRKINERVEPATDGETTETFQDSQDQANHPVGPEAGETYEPLYCNGGCEAFESEEANKKNDSETTAEVFEPEGQPHDSETTAEVFEPEGQPHDSETTAKVFKPEGQPHDSETTAEVFEPEGQAPAGNELVTIMETESEGEGAPDDEVSTGDESLVPSETMEGKPHVENAVPSQPAPKEPTKKEPAGASSSSKGRRATAKAKAKPKTRPQPKPKAQAKKKAKAKKTKSKDQKKPDAPKRRDRSTLAKKAHSVSWHNVCALSLHTVIMCHFKPLSPSRPNNIPTATTLRCIPPNGRRPGLRVKTISNAKNAHGMPGNSHLACPIFFGWCISVSVFSFGGIAKHT